MRTLITMKFFQSKEIKLALEDLTSGTSGDFRKEMEKLLSVYRQRQEKKFYDKIKELIDKL